MFSPLRVSQSKTIQVVLSFLSITSFFKYWVIPSSKFVEMLIVAARTVIAEKAIPARNIVKSLKFVLFIFLKVKEFKNFLIPNFSWKWFLIKIFTDFGMKWVCFFFLWCGMGWEMVSWPRDLTLILNHPLNPPLFPIDLEQSEIPIYRERTPFSRKKRGTLDRNWENPSFSKRGRGDFQKRRVREGLRSGGREFVILLEGKEPYVYCFQVFEV